MNELIALDRIDANPYQTRSGYDPEHIQALAESINTQGMLQTPVGRWVGKRVQLAFGHSRLEAYRLLSEKDSGYSKIPVTLIDLSDEEMFQLAVTENSKRRDLTVLETARAMLRYRDEFGKTSAEIGTLFGLSESAVRNKIRLLGLPEDLLGRIENNPIPEHTLRELLRLFDLPEEFRQSCEIRAWGEKKPSEVIRNALSGVTAERIASTIDEMVRQYSQDMSSAPFKHDRIFEGDFRSATCKDCPFRVKGNGHFYCLDENCLKAKLSIVKGEYLAKAAAVCGILAVEDANTRESDMHSWWGDEKPKRLAETKCENLRLVYTEREYKHVEGYPHAEIVCKRRQGQCVCTRALDTGVIAKAETIRAESSGKTLMEVFAEDEKREEATETPERILPAPLTAEQLKQMDREVRAHKRANLDECRAMRDQMIRSVHLGLIDQNTEIVRWLVGNMVSYTQRAKLEASQIDELWQAIAEILVNRLFDWSYIEPSPERTLKEYNQILAKAGIPLLGVPPDGGAAQSTETEGAK